MNLSAAFDFELIFEHLPFPVMLLTPPVQRATPTPSHGLPPSPLDSIGFTIINMSTAYNIATLQERKNMIGTLILLSAILCCSLTLCIRFRSLTVAHRCDVCLVWAVCACV